MWGSVKLSNLPKSKIILGGVDFFSHCCPSHLQQCREEVLNRNLLVFMKSTQIYVLWMPEGPCAQASGSAPLPIPWVNPFTPTLHTGAAYTFFCMSPPVLIFTGTDIFWPFTENNQTSNLTCAALNMRYPHPQTHSFPSILYLRKWTLFSWWLRTKTGVF